MLRARVSALLGGLLASGVLFAATPPSGRIHFDIEAGDASARLNDFGEQSKLQLLFDWPQMAHITLPGVHGEFKPFDTLDTMIAGTPIRYIFVNGRTVVLTVAAASTPEGKTLRKEPREAGDRRALDAGLDEVTVSTRRSNESNEWPQGRVSSALSISRQDLDASGAVTAQGAIRTLPQVFGGGPTEDTVQGSEARTNVARGAGINLRGLGAGSTLVLMNGRRLPGGGSEGLFVDISNLPLAAIERIDILPDSASSFYGSDAVAGVANFVMRDRFDGRQTEAYFGESTRSGDFREAYFSHLVGARTERGHGVLAMDYYSRDNLPAAARRQARSDLTEFGGSNFDIVQSNPGNIILGTTTWAVPRGQDGTSLQSGDFRRDSQNLQNQYEGADILPSQQRVSGFGTWRQELNDRMSLFLDALVGQRNVRTAGAGVPASFVVPVTNAFYASPLPSRVPLVMRYNFYDDLGAQIIDGRVRDALLSGGLDIHVGDNWSVLETFDYASESIQSATLNQVNAAALNAALASSDPRLAFNPFGDGSHTNAATLDSIRGSTLSAYHSSITSATLTARGSLATLPGGELGLAFGGDARQQMLRSRLVTDATFVPTATSTYRGRSIRTGFLELRVPLVGRSNHVPGVEALAVSVAERYEHFSDFGQALTPRFGLSWAPSRDLTFRASYSRSLRLPGLLDLDESSNAHLFTPLFDPTTGRAETVLLWGGKNRDVKEETAHSWTAGLELETEALPNAALAITYFNTDFTDRLNTPTPTPDLLSNASLSALVTRNPSAEYRADVCGRAPLSSSGASDCLTTPIAAIADLRTRNDAQAATDGVDLLGRYEQRTSLGTFLFSLNGTYIFDFDEARVASSPLVNRVSTPSYPINLKLRGSVRWQRGSLELSTNANFVNGYHDAASTPRRSVNSWTTLDVHASYAMVSRATSWLGDTTVALNVENLMDRDPPFLNNSVGIGYDQENADLTGRMVAITVRKKW